MRMISLAIFAIVAAAFGVKFHDGMAIGVAAAAALGAATSYPKFRVSTFLEVLSALFAVETIVFGLLDLVNVAGYWPQAYKAYALPRYLPIATALFIVAIFAISRFPFVRRLMAIADPYFEARTPIAFRLRPFGTLLLKQNVYALSCVVFLVLINQFQVALSVRLNFFYNDFGNAIQVPDAAHRIAFWHQLIDVFLPLALTSIVAGLFEFYIASNFVLQWRRWMTASYTGRWLINSMHYKLALAGGGADNPDQRISQDIGGFINGSGTGTNSGNAGIYNYTIQAIATATNLVSFSILLWTISRGMTISIFGLAIPGFLFWVAVIYACFATGVTQLIGQRLAGLYFRQQAVEANFRFDLARIREYSEQIALLKGEDREITHAANVFNEVFKTVRRIIDVRTWVYIFGQFYTQISIIIPYLVVAPFYYAKKVSFGEFNQAADAFSNVNSSMNFFVTNYIGMADFRSTVNRLTTFDDAFARAKALEVATPRVSIGASGGPNLAIPDLDLRLPNGRKLAHIGDLVLAPQESTLVLGPSGVGKSTLMRAISGLWPYGKGEILQPAYAKLMLLPQRPYIPIGSLRDAIAYPSPGTAFSDEALSGALVKVGLPALAGRLDDEDNWQMRLSGGEQQRLAVARALLAAPDWLFLDESTASLDEDSEADLYRVIAETLPGVTIVSIGHRSTLAAFHKRRVGFKARPDGPAELGKLEPI